MVSSQRLYRFTTNGEGVFSAGKSRLPKELVDEVIEAKKWLLKPKLTEGNYRFYLTEKGKDKYENTLIHSHKKYLPNIKCESINRDELKNIIYEDEWQVVEKIS